MNIRYANESDWPILEKLNKIIDYDNPEIFMMESVKESRVLVSEENGEVVGYLLWQILWGNTPLLSLLKISPDYQRQKHGTDLVKNFEEIIKKQGFKSYISSSMQENQDAQEFHKALEYKPIGQLEMHYGDELFYLKNL